MDKHKQYVAALQEQFIKKNAAYGSNAHEIYKHFGDTSYIIRICDKINRYCTLTQNSSIDRFNESVNDTLGDGFTYVLMFIADRLGAMDSESHCSTVNSLFYEFVKMPEEELTQTKKYMSVEDLCQYTNKKISIQRLISLAAWFLDTLTIRGE